MRSLYLIRYSMQGGSLFMQPFYALNLAEAIRKFHSFMASQGCERDKYRVTSHREIREHLIDLYIGNHKSYVDRLAPDERLAFEKDRAARIAEERSVHVPTFPRNYFRKKPEFAQ